jgi:lysophospholipase L1-like esterase
VGPKDFYSNLSTICRVARAHNIRPILLTSPIASLENYYPPGSRSNMHKFHEYYNQLIRQLAASERIELVDLAKEFDRYNDLFDNAARDPIHFNARGHALVARLIADYLRNR